MPATLVVQKYGGTSVGDAGRIKHVAGAHHLSFVAAGDRLVVVVSAMGDTTDELIALSTEMTDEPEARELDLLLSTGEIRVVDAAFDGVEARLGVRRWRCRGRRRGSGRTSVMGGRGF